MKLSIPTTWIPYVLKGATGVLLAVAVALWARGELWRHRAVSATFRADSIAAALDTSRTYFLADRAVTMRRLVQLTVERDSFAKALKSRPVLRTTATVTVKELDTVLVGAVTDSADIRSMEGAVDTVPYHIRFRVALPLPPFRGLIQLGIRLDTARVMIEALCGPKKNGISPATLLVSSERWLPFTLDTTQITPLACNAGLEAIRGHSAGYYVVRGTAIVGGAALLAKLITSLLSENK